MTRPMAFPIKFWAVLLICLLTYQFSTTASADWCKYEKTFEETLNVSDSETLAIAAVAGKLEITGVAGSEQAVVHARACVSKEKWLKTAKVETSPGKHARITGELTGSDSGFCIGVCYRSLDMKIEVPDDLPLNISDSSGGMYLKNVAGFELKDSSGEIEIENVHGSILINDSSGDIEIDGVAGDVTIESDSSGGIYGEDIDGMVLVERDSSGDIRFTDVGKDVLVERDSSGSITVAGVGGDFRVLKDGSGSIRSSNVKGEIELPDDH